MPELSSYDYAVVRVVPAVEREEFLNVGVVLFCRTCRYLAASINLDERRLALMAPDLDIAEVRRHLELILRVCAGDGPIGGLGQADAFHWLVAPHSTVIQTSPVHSGLCHDPSAVLDHLMAAMVTRQE